MKTVGIIRKIDGLGRVVIPSELRKSYGLEEGTEVEIMADGESIIIRNKEDSRQFLMDKLKSAIENVDTLTALALLEELE